MKNLFIKFIDMDKFGDYTPIKKLGKGTYGTVYEVIKSTTGELFACKRIELEKERIEHGLYNEIIAWQAFDHPNIIKIYDILFSKTDSTYFCNIIMEKCDYSLSDLHRENKLPLSENDSLKYLEQIISGLVHMYYKGYVHSDLSMSNIMFKNNQVKIIDFGFMYKRAVKQKEYQYVTIYVQPPELIKGNVQYCRVDKIDVWSLGVIFYIMCYGEPLVRWNSEEQYRLDLISRIGLPSFELLNRYCLVNSYMKLYYKITNRKIRTMHSDIQKNITEMLRGLVVKYKKENKFCNYLAGKTPRNKFIKKLINWNTFTRPNIIGVYGLYKKIFKKSITMCENINSILERYSPSKINIYYKECSVEEIGRIINSYLFLFKNSSFFDFHLFVQKFGKDHNYDIISKTLGMMCTCRLAYGNNIKKILMDDGVCYNPEKKLFLSSLKKVQYSYDRFYSLASIIYEHDTDFNKSSIDKNSIIIKDFNKFQYNFFKLIGYKFCQNDAWDIFNDYNINRKYEPHFKFLYYLFICSPFSAVIKKKYIFNALILLILGYYDEEIKKILNKEFNKINNILRPFHKQKKITMIENQKYMINGSVHMTKVIINIDSIIMSYYVVWIIKKIKRVRY